ncbi:MAG: hypothetical protein INR62_07795 [Rhodospirillales bacterium]|nr:hypothetical protein [Acetobacter sp.]
MKNAPRLATALIALVIAGCSSESAVGEDTAPQTAVISSASASASAAASGPTETSLRQRLNEIYALARTGDFAAVYKYTSPRCQAETSEQTFVATLEQQSRGRDYSGDPQYLIDLKGTVAKVVTKSADGKSDLAPRTWTYADGKWSFDNC